jgi:hypothetical protein
MQLLRYGGSQMLKEDSLFVNCHITYFSNDKHNPDDDEGFKNRVDPVEIDREVVGKAVRLLERNQLIFIFP